MYDGIFQPVLTLDTFSRGLFFVLSLLCRLVCSICPLLQW